MEHMGTASVMSFSLITFLVLCILLSRKTYLVIRVRSKFREAYNGLGCSLYCLNGSKKGEVTIGTFLSFLRWKIKKLKEVRYWDNGKILKEIIGLNKSNQ